ncbi:hypothetical protein ACIQ8D_24000 [Streptomyces sp. NPDC096094]|uniref:hypothetical protein n=1 Tax=Streptomyces sp. NPDC096094 TaxID=3366073 RepID=UPI0037FCA461
MTSDAVTPERSPFFEAVGRVTVAGANLDSSLHHLLGQIALEPTLLRLANAEGAARLIELCELALQTYRSEIPAEDMAALSSCLVRAKALKDKRNAVVHSIFLQALEGEGLEAARPARKSLGQRVLTITIPEMETIADDVEALRLELFRAGWNAGAHASGMSRLPAQSTNQDTAPITD